MTKSAPGQWPGTGRVAARLVTACVLLLTAAAPGLADERPNIVFILIDDQRFDAASALGHPFLETPHLDRLIERGVLFENAFVTTSLCSPRPGTREARTPNWQAVR